MPQPKVFVVGGDGAIERMFTAYGWEVLRSSVMSNLLEADLVQFTGGADVSPFLYGEKNHHTTYSDPHRDLVEAGYFAFAQRLDKPMAGICRGGQFLNVMNGGKMWQNVDGHAIRGTHEAIDLGSGRTIQVTSTHHQMMEGYNCELVAKAYESTLKESYDSEVYSEDCLTADQEVLYYARSMSLCFQPHPEYVQPGHECADYYFELLDRFFGLKA